MDAVRATLEMVGLTPDHLTAPPDGVSGVVWTTATATGWDDDAAEWALRKLGRDCCGEVYAADFAALRVEPDWHRLLPAPANRLTTGGLNALTSRLINAVPQWTPAAAGSAMVGVCVGTSTTGDAVGNTDLLGGSKTYRRCDDGYPTQSNGLWTVLSTFQTAEANHAWEEYGAIVPTTGAAAITGAAAATKPANYVLFNRKSPAGLGTKTSGILALGYAVLFT